MTPRRAPRVSIGMPVFNGEVYMAETIATILGQDFEDLELIVSDNASTDATGDIVREVAARDPRVRYVRNAENLGAARNYNQLVAFARGEYFKWAGYDDLMAPSHVRRCVEILDAEPEVVLAYPRTTIIDGDGEVVREHADNLHLRSPDPVRRVADFARWFTLCNPCFGVIRRDALGSTRLVQPFVSSDVPLLAELAMLGQWHEVPERLFQRRIHETSSRQGKVTMAQVAQWFDPGRRKPLAPDARMVAECLVGIGHAAGVDNAVKAKASAAFLRTWTARRARVRGGRLKQTWRQRRAGTSTGAPVPT